VVGNGKSFTLIRTTGEPENRRYYDPIDGALMLECRSFPTENEARDWVAKEIAEGR
jgi:hypothetical protein